MREMICAAVLRRLEEAGVAAMEAYSRPRAAEQTVVAVALKKAESRECGFGAYLGESYNEEKSCWQEEYGRKVAVTLSLDAYAPRSAGAAECAAALEKAHEALTLERGLFGEAEMEWGDVGWDKDSGMFLQQGTLRGTVAVIAAVEEETLLVLDFKLKGAVTREHSST